MTIPTNMDGQGVALNLQAVLGNVEGGCSLQMSEIG